MSVITFPVEYPERSAMFSTFSKCTEMYGRPVAWDENGNANFRYGKGEEKVRIEVLGVSVESLRKEYQSMQTIVAEPVSKLDANLPVPTFQTPPGRKEYLEYITGLTYTVEFANGTYATVRFRKLETGKLEGKTVIEFLSGPSNELDFTSFAFLSDTGKVNTWKRFKTEDGKLSSGIERYVAAAEKVIGGGYGDFGKFTEAYAMQSGRCAKCGKKLTVPASLKRGLGPDCAEKFGL